MPITAYVTLDKFLGFSGPLFPNMKSGSWMPFSDSERQNGMGPDIKSPRFKFQLCYLPPDVKPLLISFPSLQKIKCK